MAIRIPDPVLHQHRMDYTVRDGAPWNVLVITTDIPQPQVTYIEKDDMPVIAANIRKHYTENGVRIDDVRVVMKGGSTT